MLTADLIRVSKRKGVIKPRFVDVEDAEVVARAEHLVASFETGKGQAKGDLDEEIEALIGNGTDFLIWRGLAKLLYDRTTFETISPVDPQELRRVVFECAAGRVPMDEAARRVLLEEAAERLGCSAAEIDESLYADLERRQMMTDFKSIGSVDLVNRYNMSLAQGVLYRATSMEIMLAEKSPNKVRYLFQALKFHRLMHRIERVKGGYRLTLDGPASLFGMSKKYGLNMALFLPALALAKAWKMTANIEWQKGKDYTFSLDQDSGLVSHYKARGQWVAEEERYFEKRFRETQDAWTLKREGRAHELDNGVVLVTEFTLTSPGGQEVFVEVVGFWRRAYLERRIELVRHANVPLVLVVSERMKTDKARLQETEAGLVFFKGVILPDKVVDAAAQVLERFTSRR